MVEIVQSYKNKHVVSEVFSSTLFRRRQGEADEAIRSAEQHLEVGLGAGRGRCRAPALLRLGTDTALSPCITIAWRESLGRRVRAI